MATVYTYENPATNAFGPVVGRTNGILLSAATTVSRILFNDPTTTLTGNTVTASFVNTAGATLSSGTGRIVFDSAYNNSPAYLILRDRTSFATVLLSGSNTVTLTPNGNNAWGPTERRLRHLEYI
jgi:hypothetical protein